MMTGIRVFPIIRAAHVAEIDRYAPRETLFFSTNYDLDGVDIPAHWRRVTTFGALIAVWRARADTLELFEPVWPGFRLRWILLALAQKLHRGGGPHIVGFFAIENASRDGLFLGRRKVVRRVRQVGFALLSAAVGRLTDRVAYGTAMSQELYRGLIGARQVASIVTLDLLARRVGEAPAKVPLRAAFVGQLHRRKGLEPLMEAWEQVETAVPGARLTVVGDGPLRSTVAAWASKRPASRLFRGALPHAEVFDVLSVSAVLVAPSLRHGHWREQVGRPMQEAMAVGTTVITTDETGIASWLEAHGHVVVPLPLTSGSLAEAVVTALENPLSPEGVLASLPERDGRLVADEWLHHVPA
jgi:glycosyltransferase involved in cell wall biosynthesis